MTWTYNPAALSANTKDQVRLLVGDTEVNDPLLQDEEITYILTLESGVQYAASRACETIAALFGRKVTTAVGDLKVSQEKKYEHYLELAADLRRRAAMNDMMPYAGGISIADKQNQELDTDRQSPAFTRNDGRNPQTGVRPPLTGAWPQYP